MEVAVKASILNDVCHLPPGFSGLMAALILLIAWVVSYSGKKYVSYDLDPKGVIGTFEPILARYLRIAEFIIGVATPAQSCSSWVRQHCTDRLVTCLGSTLPRCCSWDAA